MARARLINFQDAAVRCKQHSSGKLVFQLERVIYDEWSAACLLSR